jgi:hypothetical protein
MDARASLRELQRTLYEANERRIREHVASPRRFDRLDLDRYERELAESVPDRWTEASPATLRAAIRHARVVLVGDYHTLRQSQRGFLRVLRATRTRNLIIGLEFVTADHQRAVDAYLAGGIGEAAFLRRIEYAKSWPSYQVWPSFKAIFDVARARDATVLALDCQLAGCGTIFARDAFMAWRIAEALREAPQSKAIVLVGEAHLAPEHLTGDLRRALSRLGVKAPILTVHQNLDGVWFRLVERGVEDRVDVVRLAADRYVVPASTPIAAQHSFLVAVSEEAAPLAAEGRAALRREFAKYVGLLAKLLGVPSRGMLDGVIVCGPGDLDAMVDLSARLTPDEWQVVVHQIGDGESLCLPERGTVYLASLAPTHVAEEAAHFLKARLASGPLPDDPVDFLYSRALHEAVGYFGAKVFNPKRKPPTAAMLRASFMKAMDFERGEFSPELAFAAQIAAWHRKRQWRRHFRRSSFDHYLRGSGLPGGLADLGPEVTRPVVHFLGYELGERIYGAFKRGKLKAADLRGLLTTSFEEPGRAFELYHALARSLRSIRLPARF